MAQLTVVVIAQNEEINIGQCLSAVAGWAQQTHVVDGGSTDSTVAFAQALGAKVTYHPFIDWADQRNWALDNLQIVSEWVLFVDADEQIPAPLMAEIERALASASSGTGAFSIKQSFVFLGRHLRHAHSGPHLVRLVRRYRARWLCEGAREYCQVDGSTIMLKEQLWHEDRRGLEEWIEKQCRNAQREASVFRNKTCAPRAPRILLTGDRPLRTWLRTRMYPVIPYQVRPLITFFLHYFLRLGFLDGYAGFVFCIFHSLWYPLLIDSLVYQANQTSSVTTEVV